MRPSLAPGLAPPLLLALALLVGWQTGRPSREAAVVSAEMRRETATEGGWLRLDDRELARWQGPYELRFRMQLEALAQPEPLALLLSARASSTMWWDGELLGHNGRVGAGPDDERAGRIDWMAALPVQATGAGMHELLVRASSHQVGFVAHGADVRVSVAPLRQLVTQRFRPWLLPAVALGCVLAAWLYVAALLARTRTGAGARPLLALGVVGMLLPVAEAWRPLVGYDYDQHVLRLWAIRLLTALMALLLPAYLSRRFGVAGPSWARVAFALAIAAITIAFPWFDGASLLLHLVGLVTALAIAVIAARRQPADDDAARVGALVATSLLALLAAPWAYLDGLYCIALAALMVVVLLGHADHLRSLAARVAELEAVRVRLATALLRSSIHPHWLMNTLTSLQELIERAPARASRAVDLLADEFRLLREVSVLTTIPAAQEIALCRTHLAIVGVLHDVPVPLDVIGEAAVAGVAVPHGVLHTLVENGLTHGGTGAGTHPAFRLCVHREGDEARLELYTPLGQRARRSLAEGSALSVVAGTGTRFIEASLAAAFPGRWSFVQGAEEGSWRSTMVVPAETRVQLPRAFTDNHAPAR